MARALAARDGFAGTVTGIDQSPEFIAAAERLAADDGVGDRVEFVVGDAHELDFPTASFDAVVAHTLVSHVRDPLAVLAEAARVVRPGGSVAVFDGDYASLTFGSSDARLGQAMELAVQSMIMSSPRVMRELPRLLPKAGLRLTATQAHVYAEAGSSSFLLNLAETYAPLVASTGLLPAAGRRRVARRPAPLRRRTARSSRPATTTPTWRPGDDLRLTLPLKRPRPDTTTRSHASRSASRRTADAPDPETARYVGSGSREPRSARAFARSASATSSITAFQ